MEESGSAETAFLWDTATFRASSLLLYPEARAALGAAKRAGRISTADCVEVRGALERLWRLMDRVQVGNELARRAGDLAEAYSLRSYDAIHLACAETIAAEDLVVVSADRALTSAAQRLGLSTASIG